jgi:hypothetical protein
LFGGENIKLKIFSIIIMLVMIGSTFVTIAQKIESNNTINNGDNGNVTEIRVAIYSDEIENEDFHGPYGRTRYFMYALDYDWKVGDRSYHFITTLLPTKDLLRGELTTDNYDVLLYPPDTADEKLFYTGFAMLPRNIIREKRVVNFIKEGGGYFGTCGGAIIAANMINRPKTLGERIMQKSCIGFSSLNLDFHSAIPLLSQLLRQKPEAIGMTAYLFYGSWNMSDMNNNYHSGTCLDVTISRDNPIFDDYLEETRKIRWIGGTPLMIPDNPDPDSNISVLSKFPEEEISDNESTRIHYWKYVGGIRGLIKAILFGDGEIHWMENLGILMKILVFAGDWEMDAIVETNCKNKPFMTTEYYPNENKGRIVLTVGHPEHNVWWGGFLEEPEDTDNNNLYEGLYYWRDIIPEEETIEDEFSYNHWIIRRSIAWASKKVVENDLPSVYGPSQVCDIYPYKQSSEFSIEGNAKLSNWITFLDLYYRHSEDNTNWSKWTKYGTDTDGADGWSWDFNSPNGTGYYQFYSIRHVKNEHEWIYEMAPQIGPDAIVQVVAN